MTAGDPEKYYWTGKPCRNGHLAQRYRSTGACRECHASRRAKYRKTEKGRAKAKEIGNRAYQRNRESRVETALIQRLKNPEYAAKASKAWRSRNIENVENYSFYYVRANKATKARLASLYKARKLRAVPPWADLTAIEKIYADAETLSRMLGVPHEVDHIFPLAGKNSCGLHVHTNLQILTQQENRRKYNTEPSI